MCYDRHNNYVWQSNYRRLKKERTMRADKYFAERFGSRTKAAEELTAGRILRGGKPLSPKDEVKPGDEFEFVAAEERFVSGGGYKLSKALKEFLYDCAGKTFADIGASTGGFTDCLLQNGAAKVFAVDVGESLLDERLKNDSRVVSMENVNARYLKAEDFPCELDGIVADVSFISLKHIFPVISAILREGKDAFVLIKPQFECENKGIGKSGIVKKTEHKKIVKKVLGYAAENELLPMEITNAPLKKGKNIEYVLHLKKSDKEAVSAVLKISGERILYTVGQIAKAEKG